MKSRRFVDSVIRAAKHSKPPGRPQKYQQKVVRVSVSMPPDLAEALSVLAPPRAETRSSLIVAILHKWINDHPDRARVLAAQQNLSE